MSKARSWPMRAFDNNAEMDQAAFFQSGDYFGLPAGGRAHPVEEGTAVARVAQRCGRDHPDRSAAWSCTARWKRFRTRMVRAMTSRVERSIGEDAFA